MWTGGLDLSEDDVSTKAPFRNLKIIRPAVCVLDSLPHKPDALWPTPPPTIQEAVGRTGLQTTQCPLYEENGVALGAMQLSNTVILTLAHTQIRVLCPPADTELCGPKDPVGQ